MQIGLSARLFFFASSLAIASSVWASDIRPWGEKKDYVQLEAVSAVNQHPVAFSAEQLATLLGHFYKREGSKEPVPYFSQDEISRIAIKLVPLFTKAKPGEDIVFGTSFSNSGFFLIPRKLNAGRLFVENGQLDLIIGMCAAEQDINYQQLYGNYRELDHGSRSKPVEKLGCELLTGNDAVRVDNRADWLRLNINVALTTKSVPMFNTSKSLTFGAPVSQVQEATSAPSLTPASAATPTLPISNKGTVSETEERLTLLKRLHDNGLITDTEYEQKRAAVLKGI